MVSVKRANCRSTDFAWSNGKTIRPLSTCGPTGWSWNSKRVTTPKLPPPPRSPQKRSWFSFSLACTWLPSAVTTSAESRLSTVMPYLRLSQPKPPPSVRPATPVVELMPSGVARPCAWAAASKSPRVQPGSTLARRAAGSTWTRFIGDRSIISPPSHTALPAMLWPPPRIETSTLCLPANLTAWTTCSADVQRAISAGLAVDHRVPDLAHLVVGGVAGNKHFALKQRLELVDLCSLQLLHDVPPPIAADTRRKWPCWGVHHGQRARAPL